MARQSKRSPARDEKVSAKRGQAVPRSLEIAQRGITTDIDFARCMSALMSDLIEERITPGVGNAVVNAGGKLLKMVEMRHRCGTKGVTLAPGMKKLSVKPQ